MQNRPINFAANVTENPYYSHQIGGLEITLSLTKMNLSDNDIPAICAYLAANPRINNLNLSINHLTDSGAIELARNQTIVILTISFNKGIGPRGLLALRQNGKLKYITASSYAAQELPPSGLETHYDRYINSKKFKVSQPVLSLRQLSFFAAKKYFANIHTSNNSLKRMTVEEGIFNSLNEDNDSCKLLPPRAAMITHEAEWSFEPLKDFMRPK